MKADHLRNFNSFTLPKFGEYQTNNSFKSFSVGVWMYHTPLTWYEQENLGHKAHIEALPQHCGFCVFTRSKMDHKDNARRSYRTVHKHIT
jgi:hypothetical protein